MGSTSGYKGCVWLQIPRWLLVTDGSSHRQAIEPSPALALDEEAPAPGASQAPARRMRRQMRKLHTPYTF